MFVELCEMNSRLSDLYDEALPEVYGYLRRRCGSVDLAEELTSATFVTAALQTSRGRVPNLTIAWLITVARNKLIDHWRHQAVVDRTAVVLETDQVTTVDPWDAVLNAEQAHAVLAQLPPHYCSVLTLRYLDDLSVPETAKVLGRTVRGTESLLARARNSFREAYEGTGGTDD